VNRPAREKARHTDGWGGLIGPCMRLMRAVVSRFVVTAPIARQWPLRYSEGTLSGRVSSLLFAREDARRPGKGAICDVGRPSQIECTAVNAPTAIKRRSDKRVWPGHRTIARISTNPS